MGWVPLVVGECGPRRNCRVKTWRVVGRTIRIKAQKKTKQMIVLIDHRMLAKWSAQKVKPADCLVCQLKMAVLSRP